MNKKILNQTFDKYNLDVIFSTAEQTRLWYSKINTSAGFLFINNKKSTLFLDGRYYENGQKNAQNVEVKLFKSYQQIFDFIKENKFLKIGIEQDYLNLQEYENLKKALPNVTFVKINGQKLRMIKSKNEIELLDKAGTLALQALEKIKPLIKPGITEKEIDAELEKHLRLSGGEKGSFDAIVASGKRSSLPHGRASDKKLNNGEFLTIDFGLIYQGYCSDITRTFHVGEVKDQKLLEIEKILIEAQRLGVAAVKPGVTTLEIDKICRDYITKHGYGDYFVHSTGHGLGIDVHELPNVTSNPTYSVKLKPGMVITVEPGIYLPNYGGIRIEDDVLVTNKGHYILSKIS